MKNLINLFLFITIFTGYVFPQWTNDPGLNTQVSLSYAGVLMTKRVNQLLTEMEVSL